MDSPTEIVRPFKYSHPSRPRAGRNDESHPSFSFRIARREFYNGSSKNSFCSLSDRSSWQMERRRRKGTERGETEKESNNYSLASIKHIIKERERKRDSPSTLKAEISDRKPSKM